MKKSCFFSNSDVLTVKLVKIDVEGAEQKTLEGMMGILKTQKPDILIEINEAKHIRAIKNNIPKDYSIYDIIENELTIKKLGYFTKNSSDRNYLLTVKSKKDLTGILIVCLQKILLQLIYVTS